MISVAMATFNGEQYVREQLNSILSQSIVPDEIVVCDDCSTDKTVQIIKDFNSPKIHLYINEKNLGYIGNFYKAVSLTGGDIIFLSDQDDIWENNKIERITKVLRSTSCKAVCSASSSIDKDGNVINGLNNLDYFLFRKNIPDIEKVKFTRIVLQNICQGCTFAFTEEVKKIYLKLNDMKCNHDWQIMMIATALGETLFLNEPLVRYRLHGNNALGFAVNTKIHRPSVKPTAARFVDELRRHVRLKTRYTIYAYIVYYFRINYFFTLLRQIYKKYIWRKDNGRKSTAY